MKKGLYLLALFAISAVIITGCGDSGGPSNQKTENITVSFSLGAGVGGTPPGPVTIANGTALGSKYPANPTRTEYQFDGWYNGGKKYSEDTVIDTTEKTFVLTAQWKEADDVGPGYAQSPAIHPGNHFVEIVNNGKLTAKVNVEFSANGLFSNIGKGAGVLSSKWYRTTSEAEAKAATTTAPTGTLIREQTAAGTSNPHELSLPFSWTEPAAGTYWYYVIVTNFNKDATVQKYSSTITQNQLQVTVTP